MIEPSLTLFDRYISNKPRSPWTLLGIALVLTLISLGAIVLDGLWESLFTQGLWRIVLLPPAVIVYILGIAPLLQKMGPEVIQAFRKIVQMDDESYVKLVRESSRIEPRNEIFVICGGVLLGSLLANFGSQWSGFSWMRLFWSLTNSILFALLIWSIYVAIEATRFTAILHRQPMSIDLFDSAPFNPIGRQSLLLALVFVGGILISLLLGVQAESLRREEFWVIYTPLLLLPFLIFFLNMRPTHRVLAQEKKKRLASLEKRFSRLFEQFESQAGKDEATQKLAQEINALSIYHQHLLAARTWPYDTSQFRALFFSVLIPLVTLLARVVLARVFNVSL